MKLFREVVYLKIKIFIVFYLYFSFLSSSSLAHTPSLVFKIYGSFKSELNSLSLSLTRFLCFLASVSWLQLHGRARPGAQTQWQANCKPLGWCSCGQKVPAWWRDSGTLKGCQFEYLPEDENFGDHHPQPLTGLSEHEHGPPWPRGQ